MHHAVALISLQAQLQAGATSNRPVQMLQYGAEGPVDSSKCTAVAFIPGSEGTVFAAAHWSGTVIIHIKVCICHATAWDVHAASLLLGVRWWCGEMRVAKDYCATLYIPTASVVQYK